MPSRVPYHRPANVPTTKALYRQMGDRKEANRFYCSEPWRRLRYAYLLENPCCEACKATGRITAAIDVHHKHDRRDHPEFALEWDNLEALCKPCHNAKRAERPDD